MTDVEDRVERALHVLAERIEPDVAAARARLEPRVRSMAPPSRRILVPRLWVTLAAATVVAVGVGALWAVGTRPQQPTEQTGPALSSPPDPEDETEAGAVPASLPSPSSAPSVEPSTSVSDRVPYIPTPERLAVLDAHSGVAPIRSDPVLDWVHATSGPSQRRWFIRRDTDGTPRGGTSVTEAAATEWTTTFHDAPSAAVAGVDARIVATPGGTQVGWLTDEGARVISGHGDVDVDETIAVARAAVPAEHIAEVAVPDGFEEVAVPTDQGSVRYDDTQITIGYATVREGDGVDAAVAVLMTPGRDGPISQLPGEDAWSTTTFGGHPTAVVAVGTDGIATIVGFPGTDVASLAPNMTVVPSRDVTVANPEASHGIPADATQTYGEIDRGRWVVYEYTTTDGYQCLSVDASWGGSGDCSPAGKSDCPVADMIWGPDVSPAFEVFVPYQADDLAVLLDGEPAAMTIEHSQGFTFAYGPAPSPNAIIEVTNNGLPAC